MFKCEEFESVVEQIFGGEASPEFEQEFFEHLKSCNRCKEKWDKLVIFKTFTTFENRKKKCQRKFIGGLTAVAVSVLILIFTNILSSPIAEKVTSENPTITFHTDNVLTDLESILDERFSVADTSESFQEENELLNL